MVYASAGTTKARACCFCHSVFEKKLLQVLENFIARFREKTYLCSRITK
jgi:hypothetical protein